jgi:hypothetical protein
VTSPGELEVPQAIRDHLSGRVVRRWSGAGTEPPIHLVPESMPEGTVRRLFHGGPFGWVMDARLDEVDGRVALEVLEDDRMSGPRHYQVWDDGTREELPNESSAFVHEAGASPEEIERLEQAHYAHNRAVQKQLTERGFLQS